MFECKYSKNLNIEKPIEISKKDFKSYNIFKLFKLFIISVATMFILPNFLPESIITNSLSFVLANGFIITSAYTISEFVSKYIFNIEKKKAKKELIGVSNLLWHNKIKTNSKSLADSVIVETIKKTITSINDDNSKTIKTEKTKDKYFVYLDDNEDVQCLLQREIETRTDNKKTKTKTFYILEEEDLSLLEPKIKQVKKLVRTKNNK